MRKIELVIVYLILFGSIYYLRLMHSMRSIPILEVGDQIRVNMTIFHQVYVTRSQQIIKEGSLVVYAKKLPRLDTGDEIQINGKVDEIVTRGFNTKYVLKYPSIFHILPGRNKNVFFKLNPNEFYSLFSELQKSLAKIVKTHLNEPHGSLVAGILLGINANMPNKFYEYLVATGTLHVIAASGYNISVVARLTLSIFLKFFQRKMAILAALVSILIYTFLAGTSPSVVRAALMAIVSFGALLTGREYLASWGLILSSSIMLLVSPMLIFDVSFLLSVSATAGILWFSGSIQLLLEILTSKLTFTSSRTDLMVEKKQKRDFGTWFWIGLQTDLVTTTAAWFATLPIILIVFERVSVVALLVNTLVLWLVPVIMALGGVLLLIGLLLPKMAYWVALFVWLPTEVFVVLVESFGAWKFASLEILGLFEGVGWWVRICFILGYYCLLGLGTFHLRGKTGLQSEKWGR